MKLPFKTPVRAIDRLIVSRDDKEICLVPISFSADDILSLKFALDHHEDLVNIARQAKEAMDIVLGEEGDGTMECDEVSELIGHFLAGQPVVVAEPPPERWFTIIGHTRGNHAQAGFRCQAKSKEDALSKMQDEFGEDEFGNIVIDYVLVSDSPMEASVG